jgi:hypothetical protein
VPRLSILIPALDEDFEDTLASVLQHRPDDAEVIVAHARPYDDPYRLDGEVCFVFRPQARQRVELLNVGFEAARSSVVHIVQSGLVVTDGWTDAALEHLEAEQVASVAPLIVAGEAPQRIISAGLGYSSGGRVFAHAAGRDADRVQWPKSILGPSLAAGFYRRSWWRLIRWDESLGDDFADAHFHLTVDALGGQSVLEPDCVLRNIACRTLAADEPYGLVTAQQAERLFWCHREQPRRIGAVSLRVARMVGEALLALPSPRCLTGLLGRLSGLFSTAKVDAFRTRLDVLAESLAENETSAATLSLSEARRQLASPRQIKKRAA